MFQGAVLPTRSDVSEINFQSMLIVFDAEALMVNPVVLTADTQNAVEPGVVVGMRMMSEGFGAALMVIPPGHVTFTEVTAEKTASPRIRG